MRDDIRVVITGLGTVNAIAGNVREFAGALREGKCGIGPVTVFDTSDYRTHTGGEVRNFDPLKTIPADYSLKRMCRADKMAFAASMEALRDAGLYPLPEEIRETAGVVIGGGAGGLLEGEAFYRKYLESHGRYGRFSTLASVYCASSADRIASHLRTGGPKATFMTACSSGATAIGYARDLIRAGAASIVIAGGTEPLCGITYASFNALQAVDPEYCKPFDKNRQGLSLGEGAGIMIMESLSHALQRGAGIYGEILGYGVTCDSHHMTAPDTAGSGAVRSMIAAMKDAGVPPERIDYINAHGTATPANDLMEAKAIGEVFGRRAKAIPVSSTKSMTGHTLGASGALEGVVSVLAVHQSFIPPTINHTETDPACDLDCVSDGSRSQPLSVVLSNSFAFGGNNTTLIFGRYSEKGVLLE